MADNKGIPYLLSPEERQMQLDIMRDMGLAEKVNALLGPNGERGEFDPETYFPHMLGRGNDYNAAVEPKGLTSAPWNEGKGTIGYTSLETGERTEYPVRPGSINTYGAANYDPYVIAHEIDHQNRHDWDVFSPSPINEDKDYEENRVRRNDVLYASNQEDWERAVRNYVDSAFAPWVRELPFDKQESMVLESLNRDYSKEREGFPESRLDRDTYWASRYDEVNPNIGGLLHKLKKLFN